MGKVFRIHSSGQEKTGWFQSSPIGAKELETIKADKDDVATSIPSPFARIDLVKTAFGWVRNHELEGQSGYHKLVSDALDVAQLFYLSQNAQYRNDITIVEWSKESVFDKYKDEKASSFYSSFEVFWKQDGANYNLDSTERLYFIYYKNKLVGATSPSTLFVSAPDSSASFLEMDITRGTDKLFDDKYAALHEREFPFVKYIFCLSKTPEFQRFFRDTDKNEFYEYLLKVREVLPSAKRAEIDQLNSSAINDYPVCTTSDASTNEVSILGIRLGTEIQSSTVDSDFFINSNKGKRALVLPQTRFNRNWKYTSADDIWNTDQMQGKIPVKNPNPQNSILPENGSAVLWYSEGDFLADKIMVLEPLGISNSISEYPVDLRSFNVGVLEDGTNCLLPLNATFFDYFDANDARRYCKIKKTGVLLTVTLEIPTAGGIITFSKTYKTENQIQINICLALLTLTRVKEDHSANFFALQFEIDNQLNYELKPKLNNGNECGFEKETRDTGDRSSWKAEVYKTKENYDYLELGVNGINNVLIPEWKWLTSSTDEMEFAIDFGTTNTHIEYKKKGEGALSSLEYYVGSETLTYLLDVNKWDEIPPGDIKQFYPLFEKYLFPLSIRRDGESHFPMRSALSYNEHIDFNSNSNALLDGNSYHYYERRPIADTQKIKTDLKWSNYDDHNDKTLVKLYIESLLQLVRLKAISEGCHPKNVKIKWFYPVSMNHHEKYMFTEIWEKYFNNVFENAKPENLLRISESVAPYLYYRNMYPGTSMTIDIGGGSTDLALFDKDSAEASYITSFKFAGNSIFGDGYTSPQRKLDTDRNGFVNLFSKRAQDLLKNDKYKELSRIETRLRTSSKNSSDYISFLFSLEEDKDLSFNFGEELKTNKRINMAFLLFFGSIIYYSAQLQKKQGKTIPDNFIFSGTASKTLLFLDNSKREGFKRIKDLILYIYSNVFEEDFKARSIQIELDKEPKQVTTRGGLMLTGTERLAEDKVIIWLGGSGVLDQVVDMEKDVSSTPRYNEIDRNKVQDIIDSIQDFYSILDGFMDSRRLGSDFNIDESAKVIFKEWRDKNLVEFVNWGIESHYGDKAHHVEETLFFFPLIGVLNRLAFQLSLNN
ncbi:hypothetical protein SAMN04488104_104416 [Algoriphagus faecimaris]|uniref:Ppx/GppA phosphatase family protein n=1 Tax=Algoriphagus faecimaris TaxID=686796 RepID=A0A1G6WIV6_9BACT|nr:hypothetical protein [Algoriphagus faecimaris]SDD65005.1 hypothetical protein SAMN04488104_104416 [Algoriphagus faecimaris]